MSKQQAAKPMKTVHLIASILLLNLDLISSFQSYNVYSTTRSLQPIKSLPSKRESKIMFNTKLETPVLQMLPSAFVSTPAAVLAPISVFYQNFPLASSLITCALNGSAADFLSQSRRIRDKTRRIRDKTRRIRYKITSYRAGSLIASTEERINWKQNIAFMAYNGIFIGGLTHIILNHFYPALLGDAATLRVVMSKVLLDAFVMAPILWLPPAYLVKAKVSGSSLKEGLRKYGEDIYSEGLLLKYWSVWIPVLSITFSIIPKHFVIVFNSVVSFFWLILLSTLSSKS